MFSVLPDGQTLMDKLFSARKLEPVKLVVKNMYLILLSFYFCGGLFNGIVYFKRMSM